MHKLQGTSRDADRRYSEASRECSLIASRLILHRGHVSMAAPDCNKAAVCCVQDVASPAIPSELPVCCTSCLVILFPVSCAAIPLRRSRFWCPEFRSNTHIAKVNVQRLLAQVPVEGLIDGGEVVLDEEGELLEVVETVLDGEGLERVERVLEAVVDL